MMVLCFTLLLSVLYVLLLLAYRQGWCSLPESVPAAPVGPPPPVTVVIAARNEAHHIGPCLRSIVAGDYPAALLEIVVVDDCSEDATAEVVRGIQADLRHSGSPVRLQLLSTAEPLQAPYTFLPLGKKRALTTGILAASSPLIATTDADCYLPPAWLHRMGAALCVPGSALAIGPVAMHAVRGLLGHFQALDLAGMVAITGGGLHMGWQRMGNGANLAFRKSVFEEVGGYLTHAHLPSGDDMFFLQAVAARHPHGLTFVKDRAATVCTRPEASWSALWQQRLRWGSKNAALPEWPIRLALTVVWGCSCGILLTAVWGGYRWVAGESVPVAAQAIWSGALLLKMLADYLLLRQLCGWLHRRHWMQWFFPAFWVHLLYLPAVGLASLLVRKYRWKGRR